MADVYRWYAEKGGEILEGTCLDIREWTGLSEYQTRQSHTTGRRYNGWLVYREAIDYGNLLYDIVDDDDVVVFTGTNSQIERHFNFKRIKAKDYLNGRMKLQKKYRVFKHNEFEKPKFHQETMDIALMLKMHGNTCANGRTLERTLKELKQMGIRVDVEKSSFWRNGYVLTRRDDARQLG